MFPNNFGPPGRFGPPGPFRPSGFGPLLGGSGPGSGPHGPRQGGPLLGPGPDYGPGPGPNYGPPQGPYGPPQYDGPPQGWTPGPLGLLPPPATSGVGPLIASARQLGPQNFVRPSGGGGAMSTPALMDLDIPANTGGKKGREVWLQERRKSPPRRIVEVRSPSPEPAKKRTATLAKRLRPSTEKMSLGDEFKDPRLDDLFLHSNGFLYPVYSRSPTKPGQIMCNVCNITVTSYANVSTHMNGVKHKNFVAGGTLTELNLKSRLCADYEFPGEVIKEPSPERPKNPFTMQEGEREHIPPDIYDFVGAPLIGLEYVVELKDENFAECTLCGKFGNIRTVLNHLKGAVHRLAFMEKHFPTGHAKFSKVNVKNWKSSTFDVLNVIAEIIEKVHGRLRQTIVTKEEFEKSGASIREKIVNGTHFKENNETLFQEIPDPFADPETAGMNQPGGQPNFNQQPNMGQPPNMPPPQGYHQPPYGGPPMGPMGGYGPPMGAPPMGPGGPMMGGPPMGPGGPMMSGPPMGAHPHMGGPPMGAPYWGPGPQMGPAPGYDPMMGHPGMQGPPMGGHPDMYMGHPPVDNTQQHYPPPQMAPPMAAPMVQPAGTVDMTVTPPDVVAEISKAPVRYGGGGGTGLSLAAIGQTLKGSMEEEMKRQREEALKEAEKIKAVEEQKRKAKEAEENKSTTGETEEEKKPEDTEEKKEGEKQPEQAPVEDEKEKKKKELMAKLAALRQEMTRDSTIQSYYKKAKEAKSDELEVDDDDLPEMEVPGPEIEIVGEAKTDKKTDEKEEKKKNGKENSKEAASTKGKPPARQKHSISIKLNKEKPESKKPNEEDKGKEKEKRRRTRSKTPSPSRRYIPPARTSPVRPISKREAFERMQRELKVIYETQKRKREFLEKRPEDHPKYAEEWKIFWERRYKELKAAGEDPSQYDFKPEWIVFWNERVKQIDEEEMMLKKDELVRKYGLEGYEPEMDRPEKRSRNEPRREEPRREEPVRVSRIDAGVVRNPSPPPSHRRTSPSPVHRRRSPGHRTRRGSPSKRSRTPVRSPRRSPPRRARSPKRSPPPQGPITVLTVVRLLSALENQLGSLAPAVNAILARAVAIERTIEHGSDQLLEDSSILNTLDMAKEKLTGQLAAGLIEQNAAKATRNVIDQVSLLSARATAVRLSPKATSSVSASVISSHPVLTPLPEKEKPLDKYYLAQFIAYTLTSHGRENISEEALHNMIINVLPGLNIHIEPEVRVVPKVEEVKPFLSAAPLFPSAANIGNETRSSISNPFEDNFGGSQTSSARRSIDGGPMRSLNPEPPKQEQEMLGEFSLDELKTLISNFRNLTPTEQKDLVTYMKRLETTHPDKVKKLRESMVPNKLKRNKPRTPSPFHLKKKAVLQEGANPAPPSPDREEEKPPVKEEKPPVTPSKCTPPGKPKRGISLNLDDLQPKPPVEPKTEAPPPPPAQPNPEQVAAAQVGAYQTISAYSQWLAAGYITQEQYQQYLAYFHQYQAQLQAAGVQQVAAQQAPPQQPQIPGPQSAEQVAAALKLPNPPAKRTGWPNYKMPG